VYIFKYYEKLNYAAATPEWEQDENKQAKIEGWGLKPFFQKLPVGEPFFFIKSSERIQKQGVFY
jgi:hypothetical protein